jgi:hypothetical protein
MSGPLEPVLTSIFITGCDVHLTGRVTGLGEDYEKPCAVVPR